MNVNDFIRMECTGCGAEIFAEKGLSHWYCGHCGVKLNTPAQVKKKPIAVRLKKHTPPATTSETKSTDKIVSVEETKSNPAPEVKPAP
ncbi:MAG TPA: hypothetical protein DCZ71_07795, partial [Ruminococcus sp.]|nr:hypothetical protein [Ruminococcus sp.]